MFSARAAIDEIKTLDEIYQLFEVESEYVLTRDTFSRPLRTYNLINPDAKCQFLKKSKTCGQSHQHGYVVETIEGKQVLIGHCCAFNHLGLDDDQVKNDFKRMSAAERDALRRLKVERLLARKGELATRVKHLLWEAKIFDAEAERVLSAFPPKVVAALVDRWKRDSLKVTWEYLIVKRSKDERGKTSEEKRWYPHECGVLKGLGGWLEPEKLKYISQLYQYLHTLDNIPEKKRLNSIELKAAEAVLNELLGLDVFERELKRQRALINQFMAVPNLQLTVQLFANRELRAETVKAMYTLSGESLEIPPSRLVDEIDRSIREHYNAAGLRIAS